MKRYEWQNDGMVVCGPNLEYAPDGSSEYVIYEDVEPIVADRDIKAANLQLLVENVLSYDDACQRCESSGNDGGDVYEAVETWKQLVDLARSLKR